MERHKEPTNAELMLVNAKEKIAVLEKKVKFYKEQFSRLVTFKCGVAELLKDAAPDEYSLDDM